VISLILFLQIFVIAQDEAIAPVVENTETPIQDEAVEEESSEITSNEEISVDVVEEVYSDIGDVELQQDAGLTPDDVLYFVDDFAESVLVGDNPEKALEYKEEKIAEAKQMIEEGKVEEAKESLQKAEEHSEILEREVSPEIEKRTRESSKAVKEVFDDLGDAVEGEEWSEVRERIEEQSEVEDKIALAAKISSQVKELCQTLSKLDPVEYSRVCSIEKSGPKWQRNLDKELTKEQEKEAKEFFEIMSQCLSTSGRECRCEDISVPAFSEKCSIIAPLEIKCDEGDEESCELADKEAEDIEDLLPDHLLDALFDATDNLDEDRFDSRAPRECVEAGANDRESCFKIMFELNAPEECVLALKEGKISPTNEREARQECEKIMFELNAPEECVEAGLRNLKECGKLMFKLNAPEECIDAGLTGENRGDEKKCRELMRSEDFRGQGFGPDGMRCPPGERPGINDQGRPSCIRGRPAEGFGRNCRDITNSEERLRCYDSATQGVGKNFEERREQAGWPWQCVEANTLTRESCENTMRSWGEKQREREEFRRPEERQEFRSSEERRDFREGSPPAGCEGLSPEECGRRFEGEEQQFIRPSEDGEFMVTPEGQQPPEGFISPPEGTTTQEPVSETSSDSGSSTTESGSSSGGETTTSESSGGGESGGETTGAVISIDNGFLNYYFR